MLEWISFGGAVALLLTLLAAIAKNSYWRGEVDTDRGNFKDFMKEVRTETQDWCNMNVTPTRRPCRET